jgi:hypothetical protein
MRKKKYDDLDSSWHYGHSRNIWPTIHNHFMKYKNYDRMHIEGCKVWCRYLWWDEGDIHPNSFYGLLIKACFTAGYARAKLDMEEGNHE